MDDFTQAQLSCMSVDELIERATKESSIAGGSGSADVHHGRARTCLEIANLRLMQEDQMLRREQSKIAKQANMLNERNLQVNEESARSASQSSATMNIATEQLANSTASLKWATWALVAFTAVQALIALVALYKR